MIEKGRRMRLDGFKSVALVVVKLMDCDCMFGIFVSHLHETEFFLLLSALK